MVKKNNATCSICGKSYHLCVSCRDSMAVNPWKMHTDTSECYKVFQIVKGYTTNVYTKEEAKEKFKNVDLSNLENFMPHIKQIVKDILKEEKIVSKPVKEVDTIIVEEEIPVVEKTITSRKRNYKVEVE